MNPVVTVWTKPSCMQCTQVKRMLERLGVPYVEADLTAPENASTLERFIWQGYKSAPVTQYRDITFAGFNPDALKVLAQRYWDDTAQGGETA